MNWGKGVMITLLAFAGMMTYFMVRAMNHPESLITEHYYEQELGYQQRINATERANASYAHLHIMADRAHVNVNMNGPATPIDGHLHLVRFNDTSADRDLSISGPGDQDFTQAVALRPGLYLAQLEWSSGGTTYFHEEKVLVP